MFAERLPCVRGSLWGSEGTPSLAPSGTLRNRVLLPLFGQETQTSQLPKARD